jgi:hypothetical protein
MQAKVPIWADTVHDQSELAGELVLDENLPVSF